MANDEHVALLKKGVDAWNAWRDENPDIRPDLRGADLSEADLSGANLSSADLSSADLTGAILARTNLRKADLYEANLSKAYLILANLSGADLTRAVLGPAYFIRASLREANLTGAGLLGADFRGADLTRAAGLFKANLSGANLSHADLSEVDLTGAILTGVDLKEASLFQANLREANLSGAHLTGAILSDATLVETDLTGADLTDCRVYGVSAWRLKLERTKQQNLVITDVDEPTVTVDNIEVAQFVYLLLHNEKIRDVIDTIGKKGVLLLGRFTQGRLHILEGLRDKLRRLGFVPMVFNFDKPETKNFTETVQLLANLSRFVIVDISNPRSAPLELQATVPDYMIPFVPILQVGEEPFAMFVDLQNMYDWMLKPVIGYPSVDRLLEVLEDEIIRPAETKFKELLARRTTQLSVKNL